MAEHNDRTTDRSNAPGSGRSQSGSGSTGQSWQDSATNGGRKEATNVVDDVQQQAGQVASAVQQQASSMVASQLHQAGSSVESVAQAFRETGQQLRGQDQAAIAQYTDRAAQQLESLAGYLQGRDLGELMDDVERFARREPALFLGGAVAAGLFLARFLKSSSPDRGYGNRRYSSTEYPIQQYEQRFDRYGSRYDARPRGSQSARYYREGWGESPRRYGRDEEAW